jgi:flagellin-like hook-associated protein FlgL
MSSVSLSAGVRQSLIALQSTSAASMLTQNHLATGKKVNSALDNPQSYFTSQGLSNRAGDLSKLLDDMGQGVQTLQAANNGIGGIGKLVDSAKSTLRQVQQTTVTDAALTGTVALTSAKTLDTDLGLNVGDKLEVTVGSTTKSYTVAATKTVNDLTTSLNTDLGALGSVKLVGGKLVASAADGAELNVKFTKATGGTNATTGAELFGQDLTAGVTTKASGLDTRQKLADQYDDLLTQIDQLASDSGYNGVNLLSGNDLKLSFNESGKSSLAIKGTDLSSSGLKLSASTGGFAKDSDVTTAIANLTTASTTLRSQASTFGSNLSVVQNRQDFTKNMVNTLQQGSDNLTLADSNEEAANLLALQTRQQLSQASLSMASQADQAVLKLL